MEVIIDRPMGSKHPKHGFIYEVNYGHVPNTKSPDGEGLDAYFLGIDKQSLVSQSPGKPVEKAKGVCIAVIHRTDDEDDKLVVVPREKDFSNEEIEKLVEFQEKYFKHEIIKHSTPGVEQPQKRPLNVPKNKIDPTP